MKRAIILFAYIASHLYSMSQTTIESFDILSAEYMETATDYAKIRDINGGTVIIPEFDETCPEQLKAPFFFRLQVNGRIHASLSTY